MLPDAPAICRIHLDFMRWADQKLLNAVRAIDPVVASHAAGVSFESMTGTVQHIYRAERVWFRRVNGEPNCQITEVETPSLEELAELWPQLLEGWRVWGAELNTDGWFRSILSRNSAGVESRLPFWQIVLHVVNHGSYHRGQVISMLRQAAAPVISTDLIAYYRALASGSVA